MPVPLDGNDIIRGLIFLILLIIAFFWHLSQTGKSKKMAISFVLIWIGIPAGIYGMNFIKSKWNAYKLEKVCENHLVVINEVELLPQSKFTVHESLVFPIDRILFDKVSSADTRYFISQLINVPNIKYLEKALFKEYKTESLYSETGEFNFRKELEPRRKESLSRYRLKQTRSSKKKNYVTVYISHYQLLDQQTDKVVVEWSDNSLIGKNYLESTFDVENRCKNSTYKQTPSKFSELVKLLNSENKVEENKI